MVFQFIEFLLQFNGNLINNEDPHRHIETDKRPYAEYPNETSSGERETSKTAFSKFMPQILPDDEIVGINGINI